MGCGFGMDIVGWFGLVWGLGLRTWDGLWNDLGSHSSAEDSHGEGVLGVSGWFKGYGSKGELGGGKKGWRFVMGFEQWCWWTSCFCSSVRVLRLGSSYADGYEDRLQVLTMDMVKRTKRMFSSHLSTMPRADA